MQATQTRGRAQIDIDIILWVELGRPQTAEAWHKALLLPNRYTVERVERQIYPTTFYDRFRLTLASETIPAQEKLVADLWATQSHRALSEIAYASTVRLSKILIRQWDGTRWQTITEDIMGEETPTKETVILHAAGAIPGIPGEHGAGRYEVDWVARTATPVVDEVAPEQPAEENTQA